MPATFAHCLMAQKAIDRISKEAKKAKYKKVIEYVQMIGEKNNFVITGAAGPDYPYLTEPVTTVIVPIGHTWANRMHYENTLLFIKEGVRSLSGMDTTSDAFAIRLAWFCGFISHVLADSYVHPVVNSIVGGRYIFTHEEHGKCELIQDAYIFNKLTGEDIVSADPKGGKLGYLHILDEANDPDNNNRIHPEVRNFWKDLLEAAHPYAEQYFKNINPDLWHYNYKHGINFIADPGAIFRHVAGLIGKEYKRWDEVAPEDKAKYVEKVILPDNSTSHYDAVFDKAVGIIVNAWLNFLDVIAKQNPEGVSKFIKDWDLDSGVDQSHIELWE